MWRIAKYAALGTVAVLFLLSAILSIVHSEAIQTIAIQVTDPETEYRDKHLLFIGAKDQLPDYRLEIIDAKGRSHPLGTHVNTSAADPISWTLQEPFSLYRAVAIRVVDQDKIESDVLEEVQITGDRIVGERYRYRIELTRTVKAGMEYFADTPVGMVILGALGAALIVLILSYVA